jgi:hypothetical protein
MRLFALLALLPSVICMTACPAADDGTESADGADDGSGAPTSAPSDDGGATMTAADDAMTQDETAAADDGGGQQTWGAPCAVDDDCVALLGDGAVCLFQAVVYELPEGYCTKPCSLPDNMATIVEDAPDCDPAGGVHCIGQKTVSFEYCAVPCTDNGQCTRESYECRQMPQIAQPDDPSFCLMPDCCLQDCGAC